MTERRGRQTRELSQRISFDALKQWVVFTIAFVIVAALMNATVIPRLGDWVADRTTDWRVLYSIDYSLKDILDGMGFRNEDGTYNLTELGKLEDDRGFLGDGIVAEDAMSLDFDLTSKYGELYNLVGSLERDEQWEFRVDDGKYIIVSRSVDGPSTATAAAVDSDGTTYLYTTFENMLATQLFGFMTMEEAEYALRMRAINEAVEKRVGEMGLREGYMEKLVLDQIPLSRDSADWQMLWNDNGTLSYRDLSVYNLIRQFKMPTLVALYFVGVVIIVLHALRRSLHSFDELSGAVGSIIANREEPVELPDDLATVRDELNSIRLAALADERAAVAAERRKDELVAYLAHDVKTPLTSVIGYLSLLDEAPDLPQEPREKYTRIAFEKACRLEGLIDEFFEITRYNLQAIPIERGWVSVKLFCEQVAEGFYVEAEARELAIEVDAPEGERFFVDADKLARALGNVVRNAIAYADPGTAIELRATTIEDDEGPLWKLTVTDRGREISQAHLKSIFDKFYREDSARGTQEGGTGLGLAIAQEIVMSHKGSIEADSADGVTTFTITLPKIPDPSQLSSPPSRPATS